MYSYQAKEFQSPHLPSCLASITGVIPEDAHTTAHHNTVPETKADTESHTYQFRGTLPPSSLDIALMKLRVGYAVFFISHSRANILLVEAYPLCLIYA